MNDDIDNKDGCELHYLREKRDALQAQIDDIDSRIAEIKGKRHQ